MSPGSKIRCAIYTRKSSDEGLDQDFNSLDAQYEACAAYVASQRHEGWRLLPRRFDDGGISGGTLERPALQRLMAEVEAGRIDMVVVYKIDRLTRSLADFARLVETLEQANCSFVSVTQAFNTSSSMGRLTLNVLLSFAQFEREVTAERIRDKIAASKKKGLWMGGTVPLGYDPHSDPNTRVLVPNPAEASTVRRIFALYVELGCLRRVEDAAKQEGLCSKRHLHADGRVTGDRPLSRGQIYYLLRNPVYLGRIRHKDKVWPGQHDPIIEESIWDEVQNRLQQATHRSRSRSPANPGAPNGEAWLVSKLRDETGDRLTPSHTTRRGRRLRYYLSNRLISGGPDPTGWRLPAPMLEDTIADLLLRHLGTAMRTHRLLARPDVTRVETISAAASGLLTRLRETGGRVAAPLIASGTITRDEIRLVLDAVGLAAELGIAAQDLSSDLQVIVAPLRIRRRGVETKIIAGEVLAKPDPCLRDMLIRAHGWAGKLKSGTPLTDLARREGHSESFLRTRTQLAFLSPKIQTAILDGTQPVELSLSRLIRKTLPLDWSEQDRMFGF